jgi:glutamyl-tRNA reductase
LAQRTGIDHADLETLPDALRAADLVVSATGAVGSVIDHGMIAAAMQGRGSRPLIMIDLAVPRDIDPGVASVEHAHLFDVMALRDRFALGDAETAEDIERAHGIVADEVHRYVVRRRGDALAPLISAIRRRGDDIVAGELERHASKLHDLTPDERAAVEALARGVAAKLLHDPIVELKERSEPGDDAVHARVLAELLGLELDQP